VRMMGIAHFFDNELGGSSSGEEKHGLTPLGTFPRDLRLFFCCCCLLLFECVHFFLRGARRTGAEI